MASGVGGWMRVLAVAVGLALGAASNARAQVPTQDATAKGAASGLPVPRFVSLKSDRVNVRRGPGPDHAIDWVFSRAGLPVEVIGESDHWRQVRDSEGYQGWVFHSLLSGRRTALVAPWSKDEAFHLHERRSATSDVVAKLQPNVLGHVVGCDGEWCELSINGYAGFIRQESLWGVYRGERVQ